MILIPRSLSETGTIPERRNDWGETRGVKGQKIEQEEAGRRHIRKHVVRCWRLLCSAGVCVLLESTFRRRRFRGFGHGRKRLARVISQNSRCHQLRRTGSKCYSDSSCLAAEWTLVRPPSPVDGKLGFWAGGCGRGVRAKQGVLPARLKSTWQPQCPSAGPVQACRASLNKEVPCGYPHGSTVRPECPGSITAIWARYTYTRPVPIQCSHCPLTSLVPQGPRLPVARYH